MNEYNNYGGGMPNNGNMPSNGYIPGKNQAVASMVLGIIAVVLWFFGYSSIVSVVLGIVGLFLAGRSKAEGYEGGMRTAGFVLSLVGLIGGSLIFVSCVACVACVGVMGTM